MCLAWDLIQQHTHPCSRWHHAWERKKVFLIRDVASTLKRIKKGFQVFIEIKKSFCRWWRRTCSNKTQRVSFSESTSINCFFPIERGLRKSKRVHDQPIVMQEIEFAIEGRWKNLCERLQDNLRKNKRWKVRREPDKHKVRLKLSFHFCYMTVPAGIQLLLQRLWKQQNHHHNAYENQVQVVFIVNRISVSVVVSLSCVGWWWCMVHV